MNEEETRFPFAHYDGLSEELELESIRYSRRLDEEEEAV
jgi:hypothetical protein